MNEIRWKRGVPTEEECRECFIFWGGIDDSPEFWRMFQPSVTKAKDFKDGWYAAVRILSPETPAEDPEDWVTQSEVIPRYPQDQWCWMPKGKTPTESDWQTIDGKFAFSKHGDPEGKYEHAEILHVRCRRKDLPTAEPVIRESRNTETEGPQAGQFWQTGRGFRRLILGVTTDGDFVCELPDGFVSRAAKGLVKSSWKHLPWCKNWTDVPPKKTKTQVRYVRYQWFDEDDVQNHCTGWTRTDDVREVPL